MTLSAKQIIADRDIAQDGARHITERVAAGDRRAERLTALEDFFLSMQPRPIKELNKAEIAHMCWGKDGRIIDIETTRWREDLFWVLPPTHFIPLDALPLPEGE